MEGTVLRILENFSENFRCVKNTSKPCYFLLPNWAGVVVGLIKSVSILKTMNIAENISYIIDSRILPLKKEKKKVRRYSKCF